MNRDAMHRLGVCIQHALASGDGQWLLDHCARKTIQRGEVWSSWHEGGCGILADALKLMFPKGQVVGVWTAPRYDPENFDDDDPDQGAVLAHVMLKLADSKGVEWFLDDRGARAAHEVEEDWSSDDERWWLDTAEPRQGVATSKRHSELVAKFLTRECLEKP